MNRCQTCYATLLVVAFIGGCVSPSPRPEPGGYYGGDRPPQNWSADIAAIPDVQPRHEPLSASGNSPYEVFGKKYRPLASADGYVQRGIASWYGSKFHGRRTSSGEPYDMFAMTAAHPLLPLPTYVRVTNLDNGQSVVVKVNDRGPFLHQRILDLSYAAAHQLDIVQRGTASVEIRALTPRRPASTVVSASHSAEQPLATQQVSNHSIVLQIGAYVNRNNANEMRQRLHHAGYPARVVPSPNPPQPANVLYQVQVGPFADSHTAQLKQQALETMLGHAVMSLLQR